MLPRPNPDANAPRLVLVTELADHLGRTKTGVLYMCRRLKIETRLVQGRAGRASLALTVEDAKRIIDHDIKRAIIVSPDSL